MAEKNRKFYMNKTLFIVAVVFLLSTVTSLIYAPEMFAYDIFVFGYVGNCVMVICMGTRVDKHKQIRDKAHSEGNWSEEKRQEAQKLFKLS